ncbi:MAG: leucine-rich repeat protein, partial [Clostridia bacterium]|nr:leucine-rich repeat protein [Clostridia bacterium]
PQVNIIVIKAECDATGTFKRTSDLVFGLYYAIERDVSVVNMSFGVEALVDPFAEAAQLALDSDVICVAAAGNNATANLTWPAAGENVFGVGALANNSWDLAEYSNYGENVDFVAPGTVYTTQMGGSYGGMNGTSFASPITAGVLALYMSQNMYTEFRTVEELLYASCCDLGDLGPDWYYGYGALDVGALMLEEQGTVTFNMMTDELDNTAQVFIRSHTLQNMPIPDRLYAIFDGWYYDPQCTDEYVWYEDEFHNDLTLYANWVNEDDGLPFIYVELDDGTIEIRAYTGHRRFITIPDFIDGKVVSSIGEEAFKGETRLREVKLPKYLQRIRRSAFEGCSNLVSMEIPDTVTEIGSKAFYDNVRLSTLVFGQESQLVSIGNFAFSGCAKMRTFTVPSKVTTLNATAFFRNTSMLSFDVQNGNTAFTAKDGVLFNYTGSTLVCYPAGVKGTYTVPEHAKSVGLYTFACTKLSGVELNCVEFLGDYAFYMGSLKSIVIPDSVTYMGDCVFSFNLNMRSAKIGAGLTNISACAFSSTALTSIEIPAGIRSISKGAFSSIGSLAEVTFAPGSTLT